MTTIYEVTEFGGDIAGYEPTLPKAQNRITELARESAQGRAWITEIKLPHLSRKTVLAMLNHDDWWESAPSLVETYTLTTTDGVKKLSVTTERTVGDG